MSNLTEAIVAQAKVIAHLLSELTHKQWVIDVQAKELEALKKPTSTEGEPLGG